MLTDPNPELLPPVNSDDFLPPISIWTVLGGLFLVGGVGIAFVLAAFTRYNVTVKAMGVVRPSGETRIVQAGFEGTVNSIQVKENQVVKKGDTIAIVDSSQLQTKKSQLFGNIQQYKLQLVQIDAQIQALRNQINAESNSIQRNVASAQADLSRNQRDYREKQIASQSELAEAQAGVELAKEELKRYEQLASTGAIATLQIKEKEQAYKVAVARLERTKAAINPSSANVAIASERVLQELAKGESTLAILKREQEELIQRRVELQNQISNSQKELGQVFKELQKSIIVSPESGTILKLELRNSGQVVRSGDAIAQIAASRVPLVIKARIGSDDISKVEVCKAPQVAGCNIGKVLLQISAYPYPDYGILRGAVRAVSADIIVPQSTDNMKSPYYEVTIEPEKLHLIRDGRQYAIQPGMDVRTDIISSEETVLTFVLRKAKFLVGSR